MTATQEQMPNDVDGLAPVAASVGPGARLRAAREAAGLSLDQVAQQLKLAPRQVRALEEESFGEYIGRSVAIRRLYPVCKRIAHSAHETIHCALSGRATGPAPRKPAPSAIR